MVIDMKIFMILLNMVSVIIMVVLLADEGISVDTLIPMFLLGVFFANVVNAIAFDGSRKGWLALYFQRKSLEEQRKIDRLNE